MRMDPAGWPFVLGSLALAGLVGLFVSQPWGFALLLLPLLLGLFFRDPERVVRASPTDVLSPADGRVMVAGVSTAKDFPPSSWQQVSIFLSPLDVHVNRVPVGGRVVSVAYHPGRFLPAYRPDATDLNEHTEVVVDHAGQEVVFRQIVGVLARRIVCRIKSGDEVRAGDRFGVMKFGSRMDVFVPRHAVLDVKVGDRVVAGITRLAELMPPPESDQLRTTDADVVGVEV
jgi:phosphatidylserine decarboxylase